MIVVVPRTDVSNFSLGTVTGSLKKWGVDHENVEVQGLRKSDKLTTCT